jgi:hypothetical protein
VFATDGYQGALGVELSYLGINFGHDHGGLIGEKDLVCLESIDFLVHLLY